jgi:hypothetical protein
MTFMVTSPRSPLRSPKSPRSITIHSPQRPCQFTLGLTDYVFSIFIPQNHALAWLETECWIKNFLHMYARVFENLGAVFSIPMQCSERFDSFPSNSGKYGKMRLAYQLTMYSWWTSPVNRLVSISSISQLSFSNDLLSGKDRRWLKILPWRNGGSITYYTPLQWLNAKNIKSISRSSALLIDN